MKLSGVAITDNDECLKPVQLVNIYSHKEKVKWPTKTHTAVSIPESLRNDFRWWLEEHAIRSSSGLEDVAAREVEVSSVKHPVTKMLIGSWNNQIPVLTGLSDSSITIEAPSISCWYPALLNRTYELKTMQQNDAITAEQAGHRCP